MEAGLQRRTERMFGPDGRSVVVAFDHGLGGANHAGMATPGRTLSEVVAAGADAVLVSPGLARRYAATFSRVGLVLNLDHCSGREETAVRESTLLGADMGKFIFTPWSRQIPDSLERTRHLVAVCHEWGLPLMVEPIPASFEETAAHTVENIAKAAKMACEIGGDVVKLQYRGTTAEFARVVASLYRPVVILGGPNRGDARGMLQDIRNALDAGAVGITIGRNIWEHEHPGRMVAALAAIVHADATVEAAMRELAPAVAVA